MCFPEQVLAFNSSQTNFFPAANHWEQTNASLTRDENWVAFTLLIAQRRECPYFGFEGSGDPVTLRVVIYSAGMGYLQDDPYCTVLLSSVCASRCTDAIPSTRCRSGFAAVEGGEHRRQAGSAMPGKSLGCGERAGNVLDNLLLLEQGYKIKKFSVPVLAMVTPHSPLFLLHGVQVLPLPVLLLLYRPCPWKQYCVLPDIYIVCALQAVVVSAHPIHLLRILSAHRAGTMHVITS